MRKVDMIVWILSSQQNLDTQGRIEFGPYKLKGDLKAMKKSDVEAIKNELEGILYSVGVRSEARMHRRLNGGMGGPYF